MKARLNLLAAAALALLRSCLPDPAFAQSLTWTADAARPRAAAFSVYRGDSIALAASIRAYGFNVSLSGAEADFLWQTNGMGSAWWSAPASVVTGSPDRVSYTWHPTNDCGAASYAFFFRVAPTNGTRLYTANGELTMLASPGFSPSSLPPPSAYPDLAGLLAPLVAPLLPPYLATTQQLAAVSNQVAGLPEAWPYASVLRGPAYYDGAATFRHSIRIDTNGVTTLWREQAMTIEGGTSWSQTLIDTILRDSDGGRWLSSTNLFRQYFDRTFKDEDENLLADFQPAAFMLATADNSGGVQWIDGVGGWLWGADWMLDRMGAPLTDDSIATMRDVNEAKELHADDYTNLVWRSVYSNGWHWLVAYTNTP